MDVEMSAAGTFLGSRIRDGHPRRLPNPDMHPNIASRFSSDFGPGAELRSCVRTPQNGLFPDLGIINVHIRARIDSETQTMSIVNPRLHQCGFLTSRLP